MAVLLLLLTTFISELVPVSLLSLLDASHSFIVLSECCSQLEFWDKSSKEKKIDFLNFNI